MEKAAQSNSRNIRRRLMFAAILLLFVFWVVRDLVRRDLAKETFNSLRIWSSFLSNYINEHPVSTDYATGKAFYSSDDYFNFLIEERQLETMFNLYGDKMPEYRFVEFDIRSNNYWCVVDGMDDSYDPRAPFIFTCNIGASNVSDLLNPNAYKKVSPSSILSPFFCIVINKDGSSKQFFSQQDVIDEYEMVSTYTNRILRPEWQLRGENAPPLIGMRDVEVAAEKQLELLKNNTSPLRGADGGDNPAENNP